MFDLGVDYTCVQLMKINQVGNSLAIQWLRLHASTAEGTGSTPGKGTKIPHASQVRQKKRKGKKRKENLSNCTLKIHAIFQYALYYSVESLHFKNVMVIQP